MLYDELREQFPSKHIYSDRILDPVILIDRPEPHRLRGRLGVYHLENEQEVFYPADETMCDWVKIGNTVYPLPVDAPEIARELIGNGTDNLNLKLILELKRNNNISFEIKFSDDVFIDGTLASSLENSTVDLNGLNATLYPYQARGINWMESKLRVDAGLILADEMGLGKSIQIIGLLLKMNVEQLSTAVIVCPKTLLRNWQSEFTKFAPQINVLVHAGDSRTGSYRSLLDYSVVLTTYDTLVNDLTLFKSTVWSFLIFDEAQHLKNPETRRRRAASEIESIYTIPMTGTPVENTLIDLWSLADLAIPNILNSLSEFSEKYPDSLESAAELSELTKNFVIQRKVAEVAKDLPDRIDIDIPISMDEQQIAMYQRVRQETVETYPVAGNLIATTRLQLLCTHPLLLEGDDSNITCQSNIRNTPKLAQCISILEETFLCNQKAIVFSNFNRFYDILRLSCEHFQQDLYWNKINGETPEETRQQIVDEFSSTELPGILVLNPKAAGAGLNITAATTVIHYTQVWNPALEAQASARAHRRGQTQPVRIFRLFYEDTVERVMIDRSLWRKELGNEAIPLASRDETDLTKALEIEPST